MVVVVVVVVGVVVVVVGRCWPYLGCCCCRCRPCFLFSWL